MQTPHRYLTPIALGAALTCLMATSGCSSLSNALSGDKVDYRESGAKTVKLEVPPDLSQLPGQQRFGQMTPSSVSANSLMREEKVEAAQNSEQVAPNQVGTVKLERDGQMRWLVVNQSPEQVWDQVKNFWTEQGYELTTVKPEVGVMETNWSENKAKVSHDGIIRNTIGRFLDALYDTGERNMFRTRIERTANGCEIYISHHGLVEEYDDIQKDHTVWRGRPSDPTLESEMLSRLMVKLGAPKEAAVLVKNDKPEAAQQPAAPANSVAHLNPDGVSIQVDTDFDTAWRRVGLALDRSGFTVENRDRKAGIYEVRLSDSDPDAAKPGFFSRLFGAKSPAGDGLSRYRVQVLGRSSDASLVNITDDEGHATSSSTAKRIAKQLLDELG